MPHPGFEMMKPLAGRSNLSCRGRDVQRIGAGGSPPSSRCCSFGRLIRGRWVVADLPARGHMEYPGRYKALVLNAIQSIDLGQVDRVIQLFKAARAHGRRIFVCGDGGSDSVASHLLCDLVKEANYTNPSPFRILALSDQLAKLGRTQDALAKERVFVEQLKHFAEPEDIVMGICVSAARWRSSGRVMHPRQTRSSGRDTFWPQRLTTGVPSLSRA